MDIISFENFIQHSTVYLCPMPSEFWQLILPFHGILFIRMNRILRINFNHEEMDKSILNVVIINDLMFCTSFFGWQSCTGIMHRHMKCIHVETLFSKSYLNWPRKWSKKTHYDVMLTYPPSLVPNSSNKSVNASRNSIIPWAGIAICDRGPPRVMVWDT